MSQTVADLIRYQLAGAPGLGPSGSELLREFAEWNRNLPQYEAELEAKRQAAAEAERIKNLPTVELIREAMKHVSSESPAPEYSQPQRTASIPLNGAGVLHAALSGLGGQGTINGN